MKKLLNPFIWFINWFDWCAWHLEDAATRNEPYDFSKDIKYY